MLQSRRSLAHREARDFFAALAACVLSLSIACVAKGQLLDPVTNLEAKTKQVNLEFLPPLPESEKKIISALEEPTTIEFKEGPLEQVIEFLKDKHGIEIQLKLKTLEDAGVGADTPVTRHLKGISLRSALRLMLSDLELTYIVCDEVLLITTKEDADSFTVTRTYPVGDLAHGDDYDDLIRTVTNTVFPTTWDEVGGPGSLEPVRASKSLVISQTQYAHDEILTLLRSLRAARNVSTKNSN